MHQWRLFFTALEYFTRWPKPSWVGHDGAWLGPCARYFPAVGLLVGLAGAGVYALAAVYCSAPVAVMLSIAVTLLVTGAFHEDGFADVCDGLGGARDRERALEIMSDSRIGAFGAIGIGTMLLLKAACLSALQPGHAALAIACAHMVSRAAPVALMVMLPYAKPAAASKVRPVAQGVGTIEASIATLTAVLGVGAAGLLALAIEPVPAPDPMPRLMPLALAAVGALGCVIPLRVWFRSRLGGYTGDCLGATQQISEVTFYLVFGAVPGMHSAPG